MWNLHYIQIHSSAIVPSLSFCADETELKDCLLVLVDDQQKLSAQVAKSTLSAQRLRQRLVILERYLISLSHSMMEETFLVGWKMPPTPPLPAADNKRWILSKGLIGFCFSYHRKSEDWSASFKSFIDDQFNCVFSCDLFLWELMNKSLW